VPWNFTNCAAEFGIICSGKKGARLYNSEFQTDDDDDDNDDDDCEGINSVEVYERG